MEFRDLASSIANKTISKETAVTLYGTDKQQEHFTKYKKFTSKKTEEALIKTLRQYFTSVEKVRVGKAIQYKIGDVLQEVKRREDNRGGNNESPYTPYMDAIVLVALSSKMFTEYETTMDNWVLNFGLVNTLLYKLKTDPYGDMALDFKKEMKDKGILNSEHQKPEIKYFLEDFDSHKQTLERILKKMDRDNLINFYKVPTVKLLKEVPIGKKEKNGFQPSTNVISIDSQTERLITETQAALREKYDIEIRDVLPMFKANASKDKKERIELYEEELELFYKGEHDGFEYIGFPVQRFWFNRAISVKATETKIRTYLKNNRPEFYEEYIEDKKMFLNNSQSNYTAKRNEKLLKDTYQKMQVVLKETKEKHHSQYDFKNKDANYISIEEQNRIEDYWRTKGIENMKAMLPYLSPSNKFSMN